MAGSNESIQPPPLRSSQAAPCSAQTTCLNVLPVPIPVPVPRKAGALPDPAAGPAVLQKLRCGSGCPASASTRSWFRICFSSGPVSPPASTLAAGAGSAHLLSSRCRLGPKPGQPARAFDLLAGSWSVRSHVVRPEPTSQGLRWSCGESKVLLGLGNAAWSSRCHVCCPRGSEPEGGRAKMKEGGSQ